MQELLLPRPTDPGPEDAGAPRAAVVTGAWVSGGAAFCQAQRPSERVGSG